MSLSSVENIRKLYALRYYNYERFYRNHLNWTDFITDANEYRYVRFSNMFQK